MTLDLMLAAALPLNAPSVFEQVPSGTFLSWLTNSIFVSLVVVLVILWFARKAARSPQIVPGKSQNLFEAVFQGLYETLEGIVGRHMAPKCFGLLGSLFIYILIANWFGLLPGVGSIGWGMEEERGDFLSINNVTHPLLRPATADMNLTLALSLIFMVLWFVWTIQEVGVGGFIKHTFGVKGGIRGAAIIPMAMIFFFIGLLEIVSIAIRPVALSLRLFGNIFAGENLLTTMIGIGKDLNFPPVLAYLSSIIFPIPFYFLELLVGLLQAMVFTLLCAVYIQLSTSHEEEAH